MNVSNIYSKFGYISFESSEESEHSSSSSYHPSYESEDLSVEGRLRSDPKSEKSSSSSFSPSLISEESDSEEYSASESHSASRISNFANQNFEETSSFDSEDEILKELSRTPSRKRNFEKLIKGADPQTESVKKTFSNALDYDTESEDSSEEIERDLLRVDHEVIDRPHKRLKKDASHVVGNLTKISIRDTYEELTFDLSQ